MQLLGISGFAKLVLFITWFTETVQQSKTPNRCDEKTEVTYHIPCTSCAASKTGTCPRGFRKITNGTGKRGCSYTVNIGEEVLTLIGCSHTCVKTITERKCCKGFWGTTCLECPGGSQNPCNGHGTCMDGITGNGTCICKENFGGFACQECANENAYGPTCSSVCRCGRGICNTGISGIGSCICPAGYTGPECKQESPVCKALNCPENSRCIDWGNGTTICECMPGFQKTENACQELNPCDGNICNKKAECQSLGQGRYRCTCQPGYQGDGKVCMPINSCMNNNGGCPENSTECVSSGVGKNYCVCKPEFQKAKSSDVCVLKNSCGSNNGTCQKFLTKECEEGEIGNGNQCFGSLMSQSHKLNEKGRLKGKLTGILNVFEQSCSLALRKLGPFTVLLPVTQNFIVNETLKLQMCKLCIITGQYLMDDLIKLKKMWTLAGVPVEFSATSYKYKGQGMSGYNYTLSQRDLPASNGIIHLSSGPRLVMTSDGLGNSQETVGRIISKNNQFSRFQTLIENSNMPNILDRPGSFTVFAPSNEAIEKLRDGRLIYMLVKARDKLTELVKHHVYSTAAVSIIKITTMPRMLTMANQIITINVTNDGRILLGDTGVPVTKTDIVASNGVIHALDGILIPPSILPILPQICNEIQYKVIMGPCVPCGSLNNSICPEGNPMQVPGCCKGFFGSSCKQCPGGFANPCYMRGNCSDGIHGTGLCHCFPGFKGIGCHICTDPNKHGYNCDEDCPCVHGICDNRPGSKGVCQPSSCKPGFYGEFCDRTAVPCGPSGLSVYCHINAVCELLNSTTRCVCADGYEGDGLSCTPVDLCKQPDRGGCAENAECTSTGPGNATCQCNIGWTGDGQECVAIDRCSEEDRGGCHTNAECRFVGPGQNECECLKGYAGDGYECSATDPCLENNGNCDALVSMTEANQQHGVKWMLNMPGETEAECVPTGAGERNCLCPDGYSGDGMICYGDILIEMATNPDLDGFHEWIKMSSFSIPDRVNVTALVPTNDAIGQLSKNQTDLWLKPYMLPFLIRAHFLQNAFTVEQLKQYGGQELPTLNPSTKWQISNNNGAVAIQNANVLTSDVPAVNGIILIVNKVLLPSVGDIPPPPLSLSQQLDQVPAFSAFKKLLVEYQLVDELQSHAEGYTVLVPDNSAVEYYCNTSNIQKLDNETVKYHVILKEMLETKDLKDGLVKDTMLGKGYQIVFYQNESMIYANDAELSGIFYKTHYGMLIGVKNVMKVQKKHCDVTKIQLIKGPCGHCSLSPSCPAGTSPAETVTEGIPSECSYTKFRNGKMVHLRGCLLTCANVTTILGCCKGYFGEQCDLCPGEPDNWCFGNGECQDGIGGTGECKCEEGFHGTACEMCEAGRYGEKCKSACNCLHGKCNDGLNGDGSCRCYAGWQGEKCDTVSVMDPCNGTCHSSANCISGSPLTPSYCVCSAGFTGNGTFCSEINPCKVNNGGCSRNANCTKISSGERQCTCKEGFSGDGIRCREVNPCLKNNGGCHKNAMCRSALYQKVTCYCKTGYSGDGINSCILIDPCRENNGGCNTYARCITTGTSTRNCTCWSDYVGDGIECRGKLSRELSREAEAVGLYRYIVLAGVTDLSQKGPFTVFVPLQNATKRDTTVSRNKLPEPLSCNSKLPPPSFTNSKLPATLSCNSKLPPPPPNNSRLPAPPSSNSKLQAAPSSNSRSPVPPSSNSKLPPPPSSSNSRLRPPPSCNSKLSPPTTSNSKLPPAPSCNRKLPPTTTSNSKLPPPPTSSNSRLPPPPSSNSKLPPPPTTSNSKLPPPPSSNSKLPPQPTTSNSKLPPSPSSKSRLPAPPSRNSNFPPPSANRNSKLPPPPSSNSRLPPPPSCNSKLLPQPTTTSNSKLPLPTTTSNTKLPPPPSTSNSILPPPPSSNNKLPPTTTSNSKLPPPPSSNSRLPPPPTASNSRLPPPPPPSSNSRLPPPPSSNSKLPPPTTTSNSKLPPPPSCNSKLPPPPSPQITTTTISCNSKLPPPPTTSNRKLPPPPSCNSILPPPPSSNSKLLPPATTSNSKLPPPPSSNSRLPAPPSSNSKLPTLTTTSNSRFPPPLSCHSKLPIPPTTSNSKLPPPTTASNSKLPPPSSNSSLPPPSSSKSKLPPPPSCNSKLPPPTTTSNSKLTPPPSSNSRLPPTTTSNSKLPQPPSCNSKLPPPPTTSNSKLLPPPTTSNIKLPPPPSRNSRLPPPPSSNSKLPPPPTASNSRLPRPPSINSRLPQPPSSNSKLPPTTSNSKLPPPPPSSSNNRLPPPPSSNSKLPPPTTTSNRNYHHHHPVTADYHHHHPFCTYDVDDIDDINDDDDNDIDEFDVDIDNDIDEVDDYDIDDIDIDDDNIDDVIDIDIDDIYDDIADIDDDIDDDVDDIDDDIDDIDDADDIDDDVDDIDNDIDDDVDDIDDDIDDVDDIDNDIDDDDYSDDDIDDIDDVDDIDDIDVEDAEEWKTRGLAAELILYHIVGCQQLLLSELKAQKSLTTLQGNKIEITEKKGVVYLNKDTEIVKSDIIASNGIFHYIDKVLVPYNIETNNAALKAKKENVTEAAITYGYTIFSKLLKDADLLPVLNDTVNQPFTMLWPTDDTFKALPKERQEWLYDSSNREKLAAYLKVHMIRDQKIVASQLKYADNVRTMHGSTISFSCSSSTVGDILVDNGNARIVERHLEFSSGIAHGIDQLLEPPDLGARCDEFVKEEVLSKCGSCSFPRPCPSGTKSIGIHPEPCDRVPSRLNYRNPFFSRRHHMFDDSMNPYQFNPFFLNHGNKLGCQKRCIRTAWVKKCCKNHHGNDCQVCPGGLEAPCGNHGVCNDGVNGTGICDCTKGFHGTACELCDQGQYGPNCQECNCTSNGVCEDGITGSGLCFCKEGWTGQQCETKLDVKPICSPECDSNAVCRANNTCECNPFYEGDGRNCAVVDRCQDGNNPCHQFGVCSQFGINVTCTCHPDYEGDGYFCRPIDRCADGNNGNCSEHANCINTGPNQRRCECKDGYVGNGVQCLEKAIPPTDRCLEMNGNCHPEATCTDLHYEEKTAGVFHQQSAKGRYMYTYDDANKACESEGASLATFDQLSAAQQNGFHLCVASWLAGGRVGYPTTYPSKNCGSGHVGIMDYGVRPNMSEKWDAYCYRVQDVQCACRTGYIGDGFYCNGNFLEVLALNANFTIFYSMLLDYANTTEGMEFLDFLSNETTFETLFVPVDSGFEENETLTGRDIQHHVTANNSFLEYLNLTTGTVLPSKLGYPLSIGDSASSNRTLPSDSRLVNNKLIVSWDIPTFNGIIHVIEAPLKAPPLPVVISTVDSPHQVTVATTLALVMFFIMLTAFTGAVFYYFRRRNEGFLFQYFKQADENDLMPSKNERNSSLASVTNPMYDARSHFCDPFSDPMDIDFSDTRKIIED
ncbi:stabilin-1 [Protopterus annectens]|uniref:stabilin-1 n=1 Tax=Protopterus annectens TaxID=7888 RepID=UPI001CFB7BEE|nr:stabilin-1 [Protopterus annectens]